MNFKAGRVSPPWAKPVVQPLSADGNLQLALDGLLVKVSATIHQVLWANHLVCSPSRSGGLVLMTPLVTQQCHACGWGFCPPQPPMQRHPGAGGVHSAGAWWVPDPMSLGSCSCHPTRSPAWEMCCGCRMWERTKPVGAEPAQPLRHGVITDGLWSILLRAVGTNRGVTAGTWGWDTCHSTPLPAPGAVCASLEEPQGVMRLQAAKTVDTPQGCSWAMVGCSCHREAVWLLPRRSPRAV